jgi:hypothetical protein
MNNLAKAAYAAWRSAEEISRQHEVVQARAYFDGDKMPIPSVKIMNALGMETADDVKRRMNIIRIIVSAITERLNVFDVEADNSELKAWAWRLWRDNRMAIQQDDVYHNAVNDGEAFVIVDWDAKNARARLTPHPRFTCGAAGGDEFGCKVFYENDDENQPVIRASKRWREELDNGDTRLRLTEYYPDRIEKYEDTGSGLVPLRDAEDVSWPLGWVNAKGEPLGVPVIHFSERSMRPYALDAFGTQDDIVNAVYDLLGSSRYSAFRIFVAMGWYPTTDGKPPAADGSNALGLKPGHVIGNGTKGPGEATFQAIEGASLSPHIDVVREFIFYAATVTDTPMYRFMVSGQIASADTLRQQDEPLIAKCVKRQARFGDAWDDALYMAREIDRTFGGKALPDGDIKVQWETARKIPETERIAAAKEKKLLGVPDEQIWSELGYSDAQIEGFKVMPSYASRQKLTSMGLTSQQG